MSRLTKPLENKTYIVDDNKVKEAIDKLAKFENIFYDLIAEQNKLSTDLDVLRKEDKMHTAKFKQLMAKKLTNSVTITLFKSYGVEEINKDL